MPIGSLAYLILVLAGYAAFISVLGIYSLRALVERTAPRDAAAKPVGKDAADLRRAA